MNKSVEDAPAERWAWRTSLLSTTLRILNASRFLILFCLLFFVVQSLRAVGSGPPRYKVEALLLQNTEPTSSIRSSTVSSSGLGAVLGGGSSSPELDEFQYMLSTPEVAEDLDKKYGLLHDVYSGSWDHKTGKWYPPTGLDKLHYDLVEWLSGVKHENPDYYDLAQFLGSNVIFQRSLFGSIMSINMTTTRPEDAKRWLEIIITEVSAVVRSQMIAERQSYVNYLQQQLGQSSLTTSRDAIINILADEYRSLMVLESAKTFPLQEIQPPTRGQYPTNKSVSLFFLYGVVEGLLVAATLMVFGVRDASFGRLLWRILSYFRN